MVSPWDFFNSFFLIYGILFIAFPANYNCKIPGTSSDMALKFVLVEFFRCPAFGAMTQIFIVVD
jgi:hypothetical protein